MGWSSSCPRGPALLLLILLFLAPLHYLYLASQSGNMVKTCQILGRSQKSILAPQPQLVRLAISRTGVMGRLSDILPNQVGVLREIKSIHAIWKAPSLSPSPTWNATSASIANLPTSISTSNTSSANNSCHLPVLDPWHPDLLHFFTKRTWCCWVDVVSTSFNYHCIAIQCYHIHQECSKSQKSLVYIDYDSLNINETALQELGLNNSQVISCHRQRPFK